ncbi:MAG: hypothetical protein P8172_05670 [Gammaproteobacteria bacterium]|jgi:hypothetical protein
MSARRAAVILGVISVFLYGYTVPGIELNLFLGLFVLVAAAFLMWLAEGTVIISRTVLLGLLFIVSFGVIGVLLGRGSFGNYIVQVVGITLATLSAAIVLVGAGTDAARVFRTYLELSVVFALIAILESVLGLFGIYFEFLTPRLEYAVLNLHRVSGLAGEPAHFCFLMTPSVVAIIVSTAMNRPCLSPLKAAAVLLAYVLTFSSVGFFMLALTVLVMLFRRGSASSTAIKWALAVVVAGVFFAIPQINQRIVDTYMIFLVSEQAAADEEANISSLTLFKNFLVAVRSARDQPLVGAGLGGHEQNFYRYLPKSLQEIGPNLNEKDANSLFLRLISEFGLPFTVLFYAIVLALWTGLPRQSDANPVFWKKLTSTAILGLVIANSLRSGNYLNHGFPFFLVLYFLTSRSLRFGDAVYGTTSAPSPRAQIAQ